MDYIEVYKTLGREGTAEIVEKRSRFIARALPVQTEDEASAVLTSTAKTHHAASHNVFAYVIGAGGEAVRQSDDGEPSGTAGTPVLNVLRGQGITYALVVVTRYFGGTLLGTGGLARAYGLAAREAVAAAGVAERRLCDSFSIRADYPLLGKLQYEFNKRQYVIINTEYGADIILTVRVPASADDALAGLTAELSGGAARVTFLERGYV